MNKARRYLIGVSMLIVIVLALCSWLFGWGRGAINAVDFTADEVESLKLSCTLYETEPVTVMEKDSIQIAIDGINSFIHSGKTIKNIFRDGIGVGGSVLYEFYFILSDGEKFCLCMSSNSGEQNFSEMEMSYWISVPDKSKLFSDTCKGSIQFFYDLQNA